MRLPELSDRLALRERPAASFVMHQRWEHLLFLHWQVEPEEIQRTLPPGLHVDTWEGKAWLAIVPFYMRGIRPRFLPGVPGISNFLEMNVRTYVHDAAGRSGVWFYSLDCNQRLAVWTARTFFHLPYHRAHMTAARSASGEVYYASRRLSDPGGKAAEYRWTPAAAAHFAEPGTLEFFLAERYLLFAKGRRSIHCGRVHHSPYPLSEARLEAWDPHPLVLSGFSVPGRPPDHIIASSGVQVTVYPLERVIPAVV